MIILSGGSGSTIGNMLPVDSCTQLPEVEVEVFSNNIGGSSRS
jgi:hypothetical protein